jgi:ubiquinone/menaquinone biosynthesis C-methylase UbiE
MLQATDYGQKKEAWEAFWQGCTAEEEIQRLDFYGGRPLILKYVPRHGISVEAGCGFGRYVTYLRSIGINIVGLDFQEDVLLRSQEWLRSKMQKEVAVFCNGDVRHLPFKENSLSGYISLGVVEHFIEGPHKPLEEAFRCLRPGGIAIVEVPNRLSYSQLFIHSFESAKNVVKLVLGRRKRKAFFQYEYSPNRLKRFMREAGFFVSLSTGTDFIYPLIELERYHLFLGKNIPLLRFCDSLETRKSHFLGALSFVVGVKVASEMHCFICGEVFRIRTGILQHQVPVCETCAARYPKVVDFYKWGARPRFHKGLRIITRSSLHNRNENACILCKSSQGGMMIMPNNGFAEPICVSCLRDVRNSLLFSNTLLVRYLYDKHQYT